MFQKAQPAVPRYPWPDWCEPPTLHQATGDLQLPYT